MSCTQAETGRLSETPAAAPAYDTQVLDTVVDFYKSVASFTTEGILIEYRGRIEYANEAALKILGYASGDLIHREYSSVLFGLGEASGGIREDACDKANGNGRIEAGMRRKSGGRVAVSLGSYPLSRMNGEKCRLIMFKDLTDDKQIEDELEKYARDLEMAKAVEEINAARLVELVHELDEAKRSAEEGSRIKSEFLSMVSHELRTPLAVMRGGIALCLDGLAGDLTETQKQVLTDTLVNNDRLTRLITDLLDVSKIEAGKIRIRRTAFNVNEIVRQIQSDFSARAEEKSIQLMVNIPDGPVILYADRDKLIQVFSNLVSNALRFTHEGIITLSVRETHSVVECSVSDTGVGIAEENLPKLFSKFEQVGKKEADSSGYQGTGLGLFIVKALVEKHGGEVNVESEPGEGTTFTFTIRKSDIPCVMIIDETGSFAERYGSYFTEKGYIYHHLSGEARIQAVRAEIKPHLIVFRLSPEPEHTPGWSFLHESGEKPPVLLVTEAHNENALRERFSDRFRILRENVNREVFLGCVEGIIKDQLNL